jgi:hypothetical protein
MFNVKKEKQRKREKDANVRKSGKLKPNKKSLKKTSSKKKQ